MKRKTSVMETIKIRTLSTTNMTTAKTPVKMIKVKTPVKMDKEKIHLISIKYLLILISIEIHQMKTRTKR